MISQSLHYLQIVCLDVYNNFMMIFGQFHLLYLHYIHILSSFLSLYGF